MIKLIVTCIFVIVTANTHSQENYHKLPGVKNNCSVIIIINNDIISNESFIKGKEQLIIQVDVMKGKPNRKKHKFYNLSENGVVFVSLDQKIETKSISELNRFFGLSKANEIYVNGYLIEYSDYKIATESIVEIELVTPNVTNKLKNKSINVWMLTKPERENSCQK